MRLCLLESSDNDWMQHPAFRRMLHLGIFDDATVVTLVDRAKSSKNPYKRLAKDLQKIHDDHWSKIRKSFDIDKHSDDCIKLDYIKDIANELSTAEQPAQQPAQPTQQPAIDWTENIAVKQLEQFFKDSRDYYKLLENANDADNPYAVVYAACKKKRDKIDPADALINKDEVEKLDAALEQLRTLAEQNQNPDHSENDDQAPTETEVEKPKDNKPSFASEFWQGLKGNKDRPTKKKGLISKAIKGLSNSVKNKYKRAKRSWKAGRRGDMGSILSNAFTGNDRYDSDRLERLYNRRNRRK